MQHASLIITSTPQESTEQYGLYTNYQPERAVVISPGTDISRFAPPSRHLSPEPEVARLIDRFLMRPRKPLILSICRPEMRKNLGALVAAFGCSPALQEQANLAIVAGNRDDIRKLDAAQTEVMTNLLLDIDLYDLWGKIALPKQHKSSDVAGLYRLAAQRRGIFVNPALTEPFGLTLIEAAASGLPIVATEDGGPRDIIAHCKNGVLVNPLDPMLGWDGGPGGCVHQSDSLLNKGRAPITGRGLQTDRPVVGARRLGPIGRVGELPAS